VKVREGTIWKTSPATMCRWQVATVAAYSASLRSTVTARCSENPGRRSRCAGWAGGGGVDVTAATSSVSPAMPSP